MSERPQDLPDYTNPPVVEVVLGIQFEPIRTLRQAHFGRFWEAIEDEYPTTADHSRLDTPTIPMRSTSAGPAFRLEISDSPRTGRAWYMSADDERLVQLQDDRLIHNWRHQEGPYPRFESLLVEFWSVLGAFRGTLQRFELGELQPKQVEVAYINWISDATPPQFLRSAGDAELAVQGVGQRPEFEQWTARYPVEGDEPGSGYLTIESRSTTRTTDAETVSGYLLSLTYRSALGSATTDADISKRLEAGRDIIVRSFTSITNELMHSPERWGRKP